MIEQRSDGWREARAGCVTASNLAKVMASGRGGAPSTGRANYMAQLVCEILTGEPTRDEFQSRAMEHGIETEPMARASYTLATGLDVQEAEFTLHPSIPDTGASPDGLVGEKGLVEIKCPIQATHIDFIETRKIKRDYMLQMQWQMECTGRDWCDFVMFSPSFPSPLDIQIERVRRDPVQIAEITEAVTRFQAELAEKVAGLRARIEAA